MKLRFGTALFTLMVSLAGCGASEQAPPAGGTRIAVPDAPDTMQYYLLGSTPMANGHRDALIQENGRNNVQSFYRYDVDCAGQTLTMTGHGSTADAARRGDGAEPGSLDARTGANAAFRGAAC